MKKRILIIDDDDDMLEMFRIIFQGPEFDVVLEKNGMSYHEISGIKPDLILLDIIIKGYHATGAQICKEIKSNNNDLPVFLISGERNLEKIASESNADDFLSKPFDIKALKIKIDNKFKR
jgi:DNA-binding response OmpR family regulator